MPDINKYRALGLDWLDHSWLILRLMSLLAVLIRAFWSRVKFSSAIFASTLTNVV